MDDDIKNELADLGFQLVDIRDKEWLLIADNEGFVNSCILLNNTEDVIKAINKVSSDIENYRNKIEISTPAQAAQQYLDFFNSIF